MTVKTGAAWAGLVVTKDATGALAAPGAGPAGVLYVDGTANAAAVTVAGANPYKWSVTLPALTAGQVVSMYITATIGGIATASVVAEEVADTAYNSDSVTLAATQGAITWGQQKVVANVALEGALDIQNTNAAGYGQRVAGVAGGTYNYSTSGPGQYNQSTAGQGQYNQGTSAGQYNRATAGSGTYNLGTTFGLRSAASAGVGLNASGTTYGLQATGTTNETDMGLCDVWSCGTRTLTTVAAAAYTANAGGKITLHRGDTANVAITGLGSLVGRTKLWFTLKASSDDADTAAIVMIEETSGLMYLNALDASLRAANGDITVTDAAAGDITVTLTAVETDDLTPGAYVYDVQMLTASGVATLAADDAIVTADVTRRVA